MKKYILTGESAEKFMEMKNRNEKKLKERINNMRKVKVSKAVASVIDDYKRNASMIDWKNKLLIDHSIAFNSDYNDVIDKVKPLKDITPMNLAQILHNGHEVIEYTEDNLPRRFSFLQYDTEFTAINHTKLREGNYILTVIWEDKDGNLDSSLWSVEGALRNINKENWKITKVIEE